MASRVFIRLGLCPNDGTDTPVVTEIDGQKLDGEIFIKDIFVNDKLRPVSMEILALLHDAAARQALEEGRLSWQRLLARAAAYRRTRISIAPRRPNSRRHIPRPRPPFRRP